MAVMVLSGTDSTRTAGTDGKPVAVRMTGRPVAQPGTHRSVPLNTTTTTYFWKRVRVENGCWLWTGSSSDGYGRMARRGPSGTRLAHRFAYELLVGPIPDGAVSDHLCRNRLCVNPNHIEIVDNRTNILRGVGVTAQNARKTHCKHGHEFTAANTYVTRAGNRHCRTCSRARWIRIGRAKRARAKAAQ